MANSIKRVGSFNAIDAAGKQYTITVFREFMDASDLSGSDTIAGDLMLKTSGGQHVNRIDKGRYEIPGLPSIELTSTDPNAT